MSEVPFDLEWEILGETGSATGLTTERAQVFGGWLVRTRVGGSVSMAFVPDDQFRWDGEDFGDEYEEDEDAEEDEEGEEDEEEGEEEDEEDGE